MIHAIDLFFCTVSAFLFKNIFTFIIFTIVGYLILKYFIQKLSNITIIIYMLFIISLFAGGLVLCLLPNKEDVLSDNVVNSYYLGTLSCLLLVALVFSVTYDLYTIAKSDKLTVKKEEKEKPKKTVKKVIKKIVKKPVKKSNK